jgi:hypothetical protein
MKTIRLHSYVIATFFLLTFAIDLKKKTSSISETKMSPAGTEVKYQEGK